MKSPSKYSLGSLRKTVHNKSSSSIGPGPGEYKITLFDKN
jgi:hypothetical protein